jgi:hypothetical protein
MAEVTTNEGAAMPTRKELETVKRAVYGRGSRLLRRHRRVVPRYRDEIEAFLSAPRIVEIETVNSCNAVCSFCSVPYMKRKRGVMKDEVYRKIINDLKELRPSYVCPYSCGEPLLDKKILERIGIINQELPESGVILFTNAVLLDEEKCRELCELKVNYINISFNAASKESYEKIMGCDYEVALANVHRLLERNQSARIRISFIRARENRGEERLFRSMWDGYDVETVIWGQHNYVGLFKLSFQQQMKRFLTSFLVDPRPCHRILETMCILWDGRVSICCRDYEGEMIFGDVNTQSLKEIWCGELPTQIRFANLLGHRDDLEICRRCSVDF